ncbi:MAG TPA: nitroreductase family protein [Micromonosporaceae bacterium]|nr:nitroreductase family protein [Micromonosporaceae bacterium]
MSVCATDPTSGVMDHAGQSGQLSEAALTACVKAATAAPSLHNSQPWLFRVRDGGVDVYADWRRRLEVVDPSGRELLISVGAAVLNLRVAMAYHGRLPVLRPWPEPAEPDLVARVVPGRPAPPADALNALAEAIPRRHTNRRPFAELVVPASVLEELTWAADAEGAQLRVAGPSSRAAILGLVRTAGERLRARGIYPAELDERRPGTHRRRPGLPPQAFGAWDALEALPMRDFGLTQPKLSRDTEPFAPYPTLVVLSTDGDTRDDWLRAGQALERVLLVATVRGLAATPTSRPLEVPALRKLLTDAATGWWPQVVLRLGYCQPTTPTRRRPLAEVLLPATTDG